MNRIAVFTVLIPFLLNGSSFAQGKILDAASKASLLPELENIHDRVDPGHYQVKMLFKEFGGDTFEVKSFTVNYRSNANNPLYGYDYEIAELRNQDTLIIMALDSLFYIVITGIRKMSKSELPDKIDYGSYFENMRSNYIINEVFMPFLNASPHELSVIDSNGNYYLHRKMNDFAVRHLVINKETLLPIMWSSVIKSQDFDLTQTLEIHFDFGANINVLPASAFSIDKYLSAGYELIISKHDTSVKNPVEYTISSDKQNLLFNYPFISPEEDTIMIQNRTAKYIILDFWYASCLPCLKALPELNHLAQSYPDAELEILGINCFDKGIKDNLANKMKEKNIEIPLLFGSQDLIKALEISSFPTYYLITPDGKLELIKGGIEGVKQTIDKIFNRN